MTNIDIIKLANHYYNLLQTSGSRYSFENLYNLYACNPCVTEFYEYHAHAWIRKDRFSRKITNESLKTFENPVPPNKSGLYLTGSTFFNPITDEKFYWIKVGKSTCLSKRIKAYSTYNPMLWKNSFIEVDNKKLDCAEFHCHSILNNIKIRIAENSTEWFEVSREDYLEICKKGFSYFVEKTPIEYRKYVLDYFK